jgi:hypothetical protein
MLNFIVLGQIPGTAVQITFGYFLLGALIVPIILLALWFESLRLQHQVAKQMIFILSTL